MNLVEQSERYTPLNRSQTKTFIVIKDKGLLSPQRSIVGGLGENFHHKYFEFHKISEHGTTYCMGLKKYIEWLMLINI